MLQLSGDTSYFNYHTIRNNTCSPRHLVLPCKVSEETFDICKLYEILTRAIVWKIMCREINVRNCKNNLPWQVDTYSAKKFPAFMKPGNIIIVFTIPCHWPTEYSPHLLAHFSKIHFNIIPLPQIPLKYSVLPLRFADQNLFIYTFYFLCAWYIFHPSHPSY